LKRISSEFEAKIIEMWFQGFSRDAIARTLKVSEGTVTGIVSTLPPCLEVLRDLSKMLRRLNQLPTDTLKGIELLQLIGEKGV